ncbi:MAG TPA: DUF86 domain-containing protein [Anaerolineae bacterium]|nr:DUF86 domain-containing protein [Anaerolineae bacterium]
MSPEFAGIERRLDRLNECLLKLEPLRPRPLAEFQTDAYLRDIVERNLEVAAQCCIDIANRIIALENAPRPADYYEGLLRLGEIGVLPMEFAQQIAPLGGFRNILVHEYLNIEWSIVYDNLQRLNELIQFADFVRRWLSSR